MEHGYVLVTGNVKHFRPLYARHMAEGHEHPGVMFILPWHRGNSTLIADYLELWFEASTPEEMRNRMEWI